jgi:hypothetical protein
MDTNASGIYFYKCRGRSGAGTYQVIPTDYVVQGTVKVRGESHSNGNGTSDLYIAGTN